MLAFEPVNRNMESTFSEASVETPPQRGALPLVLTLDTHGVPHRWITWQHACFYYAKNQVAWTLGEIGRAHV